MIREIRTTGPVDAHIDVPGSKSITNRALVCAALADGVSVVKNASDSNDTGLMANGLSQLGVLARKDGSDLIVEGTGGRLYAPKFPIPVDNAGTTFRFLVSLGALASGTVVLQRDQRMSERPVDDLVDALGALGCEVKCQGMLCSVSGGRLRGGLVRLQSNKSSQFLSSLLMVSSYAEQDICIEIGGTLPSAPYVDITVDVMKEFGVRVDRPDRKQFTVRSGQRYTPATFIVEPDVSGAAAFLAACAIAGGEVVIRGLNPRSKQGDIGFFDVLRRMGCRVGEEGSQISLKSGRDLNGIEVDMSSMPDCVPALAAVALFAEGKTRISNVGQLRFKESDRLAAIADELPKLGAKVSLQDDGLEIDPAPLNGAQLDTCDDHRLAMSFALIGLRVPGVRIENPECVRKSFPGFWKEFEKLYH